MSEIVSTSTCHTLGFDDDDAMKALLLLGRQNMYIPILTDPPCRKMILPSKLFMIGNDGAGYGIPVRIWTIENADFVLWRSGFTRQQTEKIAQQRDILVYFELRSQENDQFCLLRVYAKPTTSSTSADLLIETHEKEKKNNFVWHITDNENDLYQFLIATLHVQKEKVLSSSTMLPLFKPTQAKRVLM